MQHPLWEISHDEQFLLVKSYLPTHIVPFLCLLNYENLPTMIRLKQLQDCCTTRLRQEPNALTVIKIAIITH